MIINKIDNDLILIKESLDSLIKFKLLISNILNAILLCFILFFKDIEFFISIVTSEKVSGIFSIFKSKINLDIEISKNLELAQSTNINYQYQNS